MAVIVSVNFTSCEGCRLQLANGKSTLPETLYPYDIRSVGESTAFDIALIQGCISRDDEVQWLTDIRRQTKILVAYGSCACFGGFNSLNNRLTERESIREVYGDAAVQSMPVEMMPGIKISDVVPVDFSIPGCPVAKEEVERIIIALAKGFMPTLSPFNVCVECKGHQNTCFFGHREICLGPITRAGCDAICISGGTPCLGCRGPAEEINVAAFVKRARRINERELREKLGFYNAFKEVATDEE
jgi:sulfhydrogenase subunit delta